MHGDVLIETRWKEEQRVSGSYSKSDTREYSIRRVVIWCAGGILLFGAILLSAIESDVGVHWMSIELMRSGNGNKERQHKVITRTRRRRKHDMG